MSTTHPVTQQILALQNIIEDAQKRIEEIASTCEHPKDQLEVRNYSDRGNFCSADDSASQYVTCRVCGRQATWYRGRDESEFKFQHAIQRKLPIQ